MIIKTLNAVENFNFEDMPLAIYIHTYIYEIQFLT